MDRAAIIRADRAVIILVDPVGKANKVVVVVPIIATVAMALVVTTDRARKVAVRIRVVVSGRHREWPRARQALVKKSAAFLKSCLVGLSLEFRDVSVSFSPLEQWSLLFFGQ